MSNQYFFDRRDNPITMNPKVSVIMPVYNSENHISEAIDSILNQTFSDFELIIINDGSTDRTLSILQKYADTDVRIRLYSRNNMGLVSTLNECIHYSSGVWIARMDADDISLPNRLKDQLLHLENSGSDICGGYVELFGSSQKNTILKYPSSDEAIKISLLFDSPFAHPAIMMSASLAKELQYDPAFSDGAEDYDLWARIAENGGRMSNIPQVVLLYRKHASQMTNDSNWFSRSQDLSQIIRHRYWGFISKSVPLDMKYIDEVLKIRERTVSEINIDYISSVFITLLKSTNIDIHPVIFNQMEKLYYRIASISPKVISSWISINNDFRGRSPLRVVFKLYLIRLFRINPNSKSYQILRNIYFLIF